MTHATNKTPTTVYQKIAAIQEELSRIGIAKTKTNEQQRFKFRGIDDVLNALAPLLAKHELCILPRCVERDAKEIPLPSGKLLSSVAVKVEYDFVSASDSSKHTVVTYGEANDYADKATNKAMSAAYKYAAFQTFCIPTEETAIDADVHTIEKVVDDTKFHEAVKNAESVDDIKDILKQSIKEGISDAQLTKLRTAATTRKVQIQP